MATNHTGPDMRHDVRHEPHPADRDELVVRQRLAPRERQVLAYLAVGLTSRQISSRLGVSPSTVETYVQRLRDKLAAPTRAHLIRAAIGMGL